MNRLSVMSRNQKVQSDDTVKTITTTAALVLALSGYAFAQSALGRSSVDAAPDGDAVDSARAP